MGFTLDQLVPWGRSYDEYVAMFNLTSSDLKLMAMDELGSVRLSAINAFLSDYDLFLLSATFMVMTFIIFVVHGFLAHAFRKTVIESPQVQTWLRRGFAIAFASLGANLALADTK